MKMTRIHWLVAISVLATTLLPAGAQTKDMSLEALVDRAAAVLARMEYTIGNELMGDRRRVGLAVCIDAERGTFITRDVPAGVPVEEFKSVRLRQAGNVGPWMDAKRITTDSVENVTFLQLQLKEGQKNPWKALQFASSRNLRIGQRVMSVGLVDEALGNTPYMGTAVVAGLLRRPDQIVYVTGGDLTVWSSPVLSMDGRMIGIVGPQLSIQVQFRLGNRPVTTRLSTRDRARYFVPSDEIAHLIRNIGPRRTPWMGELSLTPLAENEAEDLPGLKGRPALRMGRRMTNSPASNVGLKQGDVIVALNGQPLEAMPTPGLTALAFRRALYRLKVGDKITITVLREGKDIPLTLTLAPQPKLAGEMPRYYNKRLGLAARDQSKIEVEMMRGEAELSGEKPRRGVWVTALVQKSAAVAGKMAPGDLITHVDTKPVRSVAELAAILKSLGDGTKPIQFLMVRRGVQEALMIRPPEPQQP